MIQRSFKPILIDLLRQAQISQNAFFQELTPTELATVGTSEYWSAKDHVAHMTFWRQRLVLRLQAIIRQETPPKSEDFEQLNPIIFEEQRYRPWSDILSESDHVYAELITLTDQLTEEDLTAFNRFAWTHEGAPLYTDFMGNCYEHTQQHLAQYSLDRHDFKRAIGTYEVWANRVVEAEVPETLKGYIFYNLACFYATHDRLEKAAPALQQAFTLYPPTREFARTDPDLIALCPDQSE
ncbi:MAG TPA: DinB family protein [Ktedonobacteraceae bacterium]|nr:DinB family protein [Ktedonobacteraceae bacterium]